MPVALLGGGSLGEELRGLPQPPDKPVKPKPPRQASGKRRRGKKRGALGKRYPRKTKTTRTKSTRARARSFSPRGGRRKSGGLLKLVVKLIKKAVRVKRSSDFRNHGFKNSGLRGRTGFAGMR